ncbi:MAG: hypothetical protein JNM39_03915 [Bdellovibrionaceae bacterium]|nr:hypothetical protein [Pseudobdellovibrionaceae bacterium]
MKNIRGLHLWIAVVSLTFLGCTNATPVVSPIEGLFGMGETSSPALSFSSPSENSTLPTSSPQISGSCRKGSSVTISGSGLSGAPVVVVCDESGAFSQTIVLTPGFGTKTIEISQTDSEGRPLTLRRNFNIADVTPPNSPIGLSDGDWFNSTTESPPLSFVDGTDDGIGLDHHEVKIQDHTNGDTDLTTFAIFSSGGKISGLSLANSTVYRFVIRAVDKAGNKSAEVASDGWTIDTQAPTPPSAITMGPTPASFKRTTPTWTFPESIDVGGSGLGGYKIQIRRSSDHSLITGFETVSGDGARGLKLSKSIDFLVGGESYYAIIKAVDLAGNESTDAQTPDWIALDCPTNYIAVPARDPFTSLGFCVAKYEMKIQGEADGKQDFSTVSSSVAESRPTGTPWVRINRNQAISKCQELGPGYDLLSNDQWQAIAQNVELQNSNWSEGSVGVGMMYRGHSDNDPAETLSVSGTDPYDQTGNTDLQLIGSGKEQRRQLTLSNGEKIWDLSGNVTEWVKDDNNSKYGSNVYISSITDLTHPTVIAGRNAKARFGPNGDYTSLPGPQYGGLGKALLDFQDGAIFRGGSHKSDAWAGVFYVDLDDPPTYFTDHSGFRCSLVP